MAHIIHSYSETNYDGVWNSQNLKGFSQSFIGDGTVLDSIDLYAIKSASPAGSVSIKIFAHSGTFGTSSVPSGSALATSDSVTASLFPTSIGYLTFTFSGANRITLTNGTYYVLDVSYPSGDDNNNFIGVGADSSFSTGSGNFAYSADDSTFTTLSTVDMIVKVWGEGDAPVNNTGNFFQFF